MALRTHCYVGETQHEAEHVYQKFREKKAKRMSINYLKKHGLFHLLVKI